MRDPDRRDGAALRCAAFTNKTSRSQLRVLGGGGALTAGYSYIRGNLDIPLPLSQNSLVVGDVSEGRMRMCDGAAEEGPDSVVERKR
ncbi:hypothetical protein VTL71DRAFT_12393 [Oculimacula yallundae]|uniref:Uncharacterized protein n=1 Tax=Oculimacula yallundae TaxID=86028 RepID=A0ABR4CN73_9HELO